MERQEVLRQKLEHRCATSARALAGQPALHYRDHQICLGAQPLWLQSPHLQLDLSTCDASELRGVADSIALRLHFSDQQLHQHLAPQQALQRLVVDLLEQLRCESLAPRQFPAIKANLRRRFIYWANQAAHSRLTENNIGLLIYTVAIMCWSRLLAQAIPEQIEEVIEATRWGLAKPVSALLRDLKNYRTDQRKFNQYAHQLAEVVASMVGNNLEGEDSEVRTSLRLLVKNGESSHSWLLLDPTQSLSGGMDDITLLPNPASESAFSYRVYNRAYDQEVSATKTIRAAQLKKFRHQLDKRIGLQTVNKHRVARQLGELLANPALSGWSFGEEEGYLDSARLARLITSPQERRLFRREDHRPASDCLVSILVDNSGSMTHHNEFLAALVDTLAHILELAGITTEVLGFTTGEWSGGRLMKEWQAAGKPDHPGRLNSLRHTVYKAASTPWRRARSAIAGMLKSDLFREGVDGEALLWALHRLKQRPEQKKILLMISDGSPMDTATALANSPEYLDQHLVQVARSIENSSDIALAALGVGLDLSTYYQSNFAISLSEQLDTADYMNIAKLLGRSAAKFKPQRSSRDLKTLYN
ncbi:MAG: hypothetical protein AAF431_10540 [Pseudomonadota bacterium]